jgi:negative regulator of sigma E activity
MPAVNWDRLAGHLSQAVAAEAPAAKEIERPAVIGRIGFGRRAAQWAVAASVLIATGLGLTIYFKSTTPGTTGPTQTGMVSPQLAITVIDTPKVETSAQPAVAEISIGPSKSYASSSDDEYYRRGVSSRSAVVIATPVGLDDDADHPLGFD